MVFYNGLIMSKEKELLLETEERETPEVFLGRIEEIGKNFLEIMDLRFGPLVGERREISADKELQVVVGVVADWPSASVNWQKHSGFPDEEIYLAGVNWEVSPRIAMWKKKRVVPNWEEFSVNCGAEETILLLRKKETFWQIKLCVGEEMVEINYLPWRISLTKRMSLDKMEVRSVYSGWPEGELEKIRIRGEVNFDEGGWDCFEGNLDRVKATLPKVVDIGDWVQQGVGIIERLTSQALDLINCYSPQSSSSCGAGKI